MCLAYVTARGPGEPKNLKREPCRSILALKKMEKHAAEEFARSEGKKLQIRDRKAYKRSESGCKTSRDLRRDILRRGFCIADADGYWNCGTMSYESENCEGLHFLGEKLTTSGSSLKHPKFGKCCSNGQINPHFTLTTHFTHCSHSFVTKNGNHAHLIH